MGSMKMLTNRTRYLIRENPSGLLGASYSHDIRDPESGDILLLSREAPPPRGATRFFRLFALTRRTTPFDVSVRSPSGERLVRMRRGVPVRSSSVRVYDADEVLIGTFRQRVWSWSRKFQVLDATGASLCTLRGYRGSTSFRFVTDNGIVLAEAVKQWAGLGREVFTSADDYVLRIDEVVPPDSVVRLLILASVICVDIVLKVEIP